MSLFLLLNRSERNYIAVVVIRYRVGGLDLFGASYDIRKSARNRLSVNKVAALVKDYAVIIKPVFVNEFRNVISVSQSGSPDS